MVKNYQNLKKHNFKNEIGIPKLVFRTGNLKIDELPIEVKDLYNNEILKNKEYTLFYFDEEDRLQSIKDLNDENILNVYNSFIPKSYQIDFWRYIIINKYGGIYFDYTVQSLIQYDEIIKSYDTILVKDYKYKGLLNGVFASKKDNILLINTIKSIIENNKKKYYGDDSLSVTGPSLFGFEYKKTYQIDNIEVGLGLNNIYIYEYKGLEDNIIIDPISLKKIIKVRLPNHYNLLYSKISNENKLYKMFGDYPFYYHNLWLMKLIYRNEKYNKIEQYCNQKYFNKKDIENNIILIYNQNKMIQTYKDLKNYYFINDNKIPKIIFRTSKFKLKDLPNNVKKVYEDDLFKNEDYSVFYFDDEDCLQSIIDSNDDKLINAYNTLIPTAFKADLWRYYILHKYGGIYLDSSHIANIPYNDIIKSEKEIFVKDKLDEYGINNSFIACCKKNKVLKKALELCINNVENKRYDLRFLEITGPQLFENSYREVYNVDTSIQYIEMGMPSIKLRLIDHDYSRVDTILGIMNENNQEVIKYRSIENHYSTLYNNNFDIIHYSNLYKDKIIYADEKINSIKKLYIDLLKREADLGGLINYYKSCSLENIELSIKESDEYHKLMIKTYKDFKNYKFINDGEIPKIIFRTSRYNVEELPKEIVSLYGNEMANNPNYTLFYFDDKDCEEFIISEYDVITFDYYNQLIPTAYKADFWRYLILYKYGGVYLDFTMHTLIPFDEIIKDYKEVYVRYTCDLCGIYNAFIAVKKNTKLIGNAIEKVKENIKNKDKGVNPLDVTGPTMFGRIFKHTLNLEFNNWIPLGDLENGIHIYSNPSNEYIVDSYKNIIKNRIDNHYELVYNEKEHPLLIDVNNQIRPLNHYSRLWHDDKIFKI